MEQKEWPVQTRAFTQFIDAGDGLIWGIKRGGSISLAGTVYPDLQRCGDGNQDVEVETARTPIPATCA